MAKAIVVNTCDGGKFYNSMRLVGVFTNKRMLYKTLRKMVKNDDAVYNGGSLKMESVKSINMLNSLFDYLHINEIDLNEVV